MSKRKGRLYNPDTSVLWKLEKQIDAAHQHLRIALSLVRKELKKE